MAAIDTTKASPFKGAEPWFALPQKTLASTTDNLGAARAAFLGDAQVAGDVVAGNKILQLPCAIGDPKQALQLFEEALEIRRRIRDRYGEGRTLGLQTSVYLMLGKPDQALAAAERAFAIERDTLPPDTVADRLRRIARLTELATPNTR